MDETSTQETTDLDSQKEKLRVKLERARKKLTAAERKFGKLKESASDEKVSRYHNKVLTRTARVEKLQERLETVSSDTEPLELPTTADQAQEDMQSNFSTRGIHFMLSFLCWIWRMLSHAIQSVVVLGVVLEQSWNNWLAKNTVTKTTVVTDHHKANNKVKSAHKKQLRRKHKSTRRSLVFDKQEINSHTYSHSDSDTASNNSSDISRSYKNKEQMVSINELPDHPCPIQQEIGSSSSLPVEDTMGSDVVNNQDTPVQEGNNNEVNTTIQTSTPMKPWQAQGSLGLQTDVNSAWGSVAGGGTQQQTLSGLSKNDRKVPPNQPHFRIGSKDALQDPIEFLDQLRRHFVAHRIPEHRYAELLPLSLGTLENQWLDRWLAEHGGIDAVEWKELQQAFLTHFQHPNSDATYRQKFYSLHMTSTGVQPYVDTFLYLAGKLKLDLSDNNTVYQFKYGLTDRLREQLSVAIAPLTLLSSPNKQQVSVRELAQLALNLEADSRIRMGDKKLSISMEVLDKDNKSKTICQHCKKPGHKKEECWTLNKALKPTKKGSDQQQKSGSPTMMEPRKGSQNDPKGTGAVCFKCQQRGHLAKDCKQI